MKNTIYVIIAVIIIILIVVLVGGNGNGVAKLKGDTEMVEAGLQGEAVASGITIIPIEVLEDNRCQEDVECVDAGTVRLRANLIVGDSEGVNNVRVFELGKITIIEDKAVVLAKVSPNTNSEIVINPEDYKFTFEVGEASENPEEN